MLMKPKQLPVYARNIKYHSVGCEADWTGLVWGPAGGNESSGYMPTLEYLWLNK